MMLLALTLACVGTSVSDTEETDPQTTDTQATDTAPPEWDCAQPVWTADAITLTQQAEVDAFCTQYSAVGGDLTIDVGVKGDTIVELDGLGCLCAVDGDLEIMAETLPAGQPPPHVTGDLELRLLERIEGDLHLRNLANLTYLQELWSLEHIGGDLIIENCPDLQYSTLFALQTLGGQLHLRDLTKLLVFRMPSLREAGGLVLGSPADSETLFFFSDLGIDALETIRGDVQITGARNLGRLSAPVLQQIGGQLHIEAACGLTPALPSLTTLGGLHIEGNCGMANFDGLSALTEISGTDASEYGVWLSANDGLDKKEIATFLSGLSSINGKTHFDVSAGCDTLMASYADGYCN